MIIRHIPLLRGSSERRQGQSLIEAIAALGILTIGMLGVLALLSRSFSLERETADESKATYLASEGIEVAKNLIDHGVYSGVAQGQETNGWSGGITGSCFSFLPGGSNYYYLDFATYQCPSPQGSSAPDPLYFKPNGTAPGAGMYYDSVDAAKIQGATPTNFSRVVEVSRPDASTIDVISTVTWSGGTLASQSVTLEDVFYNWHP